MKTNHLNNAGPARWKQLAHGRFRPARPERKEERGGLAGLQPTANLAQQRPSEGDTPTPAARHHGGAAYPRAGASRPRQTMGRRAQGSRGQSGADAREKEDRVGAVHRCGHELRRAWPRPSGEENGHHGLSPRLRQPHTGATERARRGGAAGGRNRGMRRGRRSKSPAERLRHSVAELTARGRSCCGWLSAECCARIA